MSGDLISRGKAIENLHKIPKIWNGNECLVSFQTVIDYMNSQMIAYDVDKVVDEIEKIISSYESCVETSLKENEREGEDKMSSEICSLHNNRGYLEGLRRALEIVKSGGVADD